MKFRRLGLIGLVALGAGCSREGGQANGSASANQSAQAQAEDGRVTVKAPGVDISLNLPEAVRSRMTVERDNGLLPPGARIGGVHVQGEGREGGSGGNGSVDLRFRSAQGVNQVSAWYLASERAREFTVVSYATSGGRFLLRGRAAGATSDFNLTLSPAAGGGTEGRLTLSERS